MPTPVELLNFIQEHAISFVNFRLTNLLGSEHQITLPAHQVDGDLLTNGSNFDGSSVPGWRPINNSDLYFKPDCSAFYVDHFAAHPTLTVLCNIIEPETKKLYNRDPRHIAQKAEAHLKQTQIGDTAFFGPELEFFIFDGISYEVTNHQAFHYISAAHGAWNTGAAPDEGNPGHIPALKGGYFALPPRDKLSSIRSEICLSLDKIGIEAQLHHHEVGTAGQCEIGAKFATATKKADEVQITKQLIHQVCSQYGKTATFMPKPIWGDNGSGMHVHQSIWKKKENLFAGAKALGLSQEALYYIGGIIKHAKALNAFTNPATNSYKRLVPGFEAPVILAYGANNRSAAIRLPATHEPKAKRIEVRFPDATANPYLAFSAMLMAGLDGIANKIDPGTPETADLYEHHNHTHPKVCATLDEALQALHEDREFLKAGGVFDDDVIDSYITLKKQEVQRLNQVPHPVEFEMYYSS